MSPKLKKALLSSSLVGLLLVGLSTSASAESNIIPKYDVKPFAVDHQDDELIFA